MKSQLTSKIASKLQVAFTAVLMIVCLNASAQFEPQFTQYLNNEMFINPAYAGTRGCTSASILYRNQWTGIEGAPKTTTLNVHSPFKYEKIGLGLSIMNDKIGVTNQTAAFASYAYHMQVTEKGKLSFGLQGGIINVTDNLLDVVTIDPNDQEFSQNITHKVLPNFGFGTYFHTDRFYAGISVPRFIDNKINVTTLKAQSNKINPDDFHYYAYSAYVFDAGKNVKMKPSVMIKAVEGAPVQADVNMNVLFNEIFWIGASYRTNSAVALTAQVQLNKQLRFGYSYDYTLTKLNDYSSGSHELTIGYDFSFDKAKVVTPRYF